MATLYDTNRPHYTHALREGDMYRLIGVHVAGGADAVSRFVKDSKGDEITVIALLDDGVVDLVFVMTDTD